MLFDKKRIDKQIELLHSCADNYECELELVNAITGESMKPEPEAIKAGFMAGLKAAQAIVNGDTDDAAGTHGQMIAAMEYAAKCWLAERLRDCADEDGVDNG